MLGIVVVLLIVVMQLNFIKVNLQNIKHLEIYNTTNNKVIIINDINLEIWKSFSGLKLICHNIKIKDDLQELKIIDEVFISAYFNILYNKVIGGKNNNDSIFHLNANQIDVEAISNMYSSIDSRNDVSRDNRMILANIVKLLNKKDISNFKVKINLKNFKLPSKFGDFEINKVSFENTSLNKNYIGELKLQYKLNGENATLQGFFLKDKTANDSKIAKLFSDWKEYNSTKIILELYGYTNSSITNGENILHPSGFYKVLLTYDMSNEDLGFEAELKKADIKVSDIPLISAENLRLSGRYHLVHKTLFVKDFNIQINTVPISGSLNIDIDGNLEVYARSEQTIDRDIIFSLWPISGNTQKEFLQSLVIESKVTKPSLMMKAYKKANQEYKIYTFKLQFDLEKTTLNRYIQGYNYKIAFDQANVKIDIDDIKIKSSLINLEQDIKLENIKLSIPFDSSKKILCNLDIKTPLKSIEKIISRSSSNLKLEKGYLKLSLNGELPKTGLNFKKIKLSGRLITDKINAIYNQQEYDLSTNNLAFELKGNVLNCTGDIIYNGIKIKKVNFSGQISGSDRDIPQLEMKSLDFKVDLNQVQIKEMTHRIQSEFDGILNVQITDSNKFRLNLNEVSIRKSPLKIEKASGIYGEIDFSMADKKNTIKDLKLDLPQLEVTGDLKFKENQLKNFNLRFNKIHHSQFNVSLSEEDNSYRIDANIIHLEDIKLIIDNSRENNSKLSADVELKLTINADSVFIENRVVLEDVVLQLNFKSGKIVKIDGYGYAKDKKSYIRLFFDTPVFTLIINNLGNVTDDIFREKTVKKGNLGLYLSIPELGSIAQAQGELYLYNFKLVESYLFSTILKIYALSGFGITNIFQMFNNGINFSNMHCFISSDNQSILFENCQAFSEAMLLSAEAKVDFTLSNGEVQGLIIPKNFFNTPIIFLQQILSAKGRTLLDDVQDKQNFSISWRDNGKPIIRTNPISFILPSIFSNLFSKKKTVKSLAIS